MFLFTLAIVTITPKSDCYYLPNHIVNELFKYSLPQIWSRNFALKKAFFYSLTTHPSAHRFRHLFGLVFPRFWPAFRSLSPEAAAKVNQISKLTKFFSKILKLFFQASVPSERITKIVLIAQFSKSFSSTLLLNSSFTLRPSSEADANVEPLSYSHKPFSKKYRFSGLYLPYPRSILIGKKKPPDNKARFAHYPGANYMDKFRL